jgi:hypothetical protein
MKDQILPEKLPASSLHALLRGSIDYAGLFPPARLPLKTAVRNYAGYRFGSDHWLLGQFVCPSERLQELKSVASELTAGAKLTLSVLGLPETCYGMQVKTVELALPAGPEVGNRSAARDALGAAAEAIEKLEAPRVMPFFEVTVRERWRHAAGLVLEAIAEHNRSWQGVRCGPAGFKLRTGGVTAEAFPATADLVFVIRTCRELGVVFKCTAGLHHPVRHYSDPVGATMHGFLNIFVAAALVQNPSFLENGLPLVLEDENPKSFQFDDGGLSWQGVSATFDQIVAARQNLIASFGSCSFEEPLSDLRELQLL